VVSYAVHPPLVAMMAEVVDAWSCSCRSL